MTNLQFKFNDGIVNVKCSLTTIEVGSIIYQTTGVWRFFSDNWNYPLSPDDLRAIAGYINGLDSDA